MFRGWNNFKTRFGIPSGSAIINFVVIQVVLELIWNWVSQGFTIPFIREIGSLVVFVAGIFVVAWYLPKLTAVVIGKQDSPNSSILVEPKPKKEVIDPILFARVDHVLSKLIQEGEQLIAEMKRPDFHVGQLGQDARHWVDSVDRDIWDVLPDRADYITAEQGDITDGERLLYHGWNRDAAYLRISVNRRLARLREVRYEIST
jgi:hypothetical protein